jgi:hypothetical protein
MGDLLQAEILDQAVGYSRRIFSGGRTFLEDEFEIFTDGKIAKNRRLLGKVPHAEASPPIDGKVRQIPRVHCDHSGVRFDKPDNHIERRRLSGPVRSEQPHHFAHCDVQVCRGDDRPAFIGFGQAASREHFAHCFFEPSSILKISCGFPVASMRFFTGK